MVDEGKNPRGKKLFVAMKKKTEIDGRTKPARRHSAIVADIHRLVGDRHPPEVVEQLAQQFATLVLQQERLTARLLEGLPMNSGSFVRLVNASTRCLKNLGLIPTGNGANGADDGTDALEDYIAGKQQGNGTKPKRRVDRRRERLGR